MVKKSMLDFNKYRTLINNLVAFYEQNKREIHCFIPEVPADFCTITDDSLLYSYKFTICDEIDEESIGYQKNDDYVFFSKCNCSSSNCNNHLSLLNVSNSYKLAYVDGFLICSIDKSFYYDKNNCDDSTLNCNSGNSEYFLMSFVGYHFDFENPDLKIDNIINEYEYDKYGDVIKKYQQIINGNEEIVKSLKNE